MPLQAYLQLVVVILCGYFSGTVKLYHNDEQAIDILNRFSLYIGFPVLMFVSLTRQDAALPGGLAFYLIHLLGIIITLVLIRLFSLSTGPEYRKNLGTVALGSTFGNIAYLGIPVAIQAFGRETSGIATLSAAIHLVVGLSLVQFLMVRWNNNSLSLSQITRKIIVQPLIWAPLAGIFFRFMPGNTGSYLSAMLEPIGVIAGPISLYLLGLYLHHNRKYLVVPTFPAITIIFFKMLVLPLLFLGLSLAAINYGWLTRMEGIISVVMASMPLAVTTFSLAYQYRAGEEIIAQAIVLTTFLSFFSLPLLLYGLQAIFP